MVTKVVMPKLSLTMKEGTIGKWYKKEGDFVEKGEPIVELNSEKATYDLESPAAGVLRRILVSEGVDAAVNQTLAIITGSDEVFSEEESKEATQPTVETEARIPASPAAKRLAREHGIDLALVRASVGEERISEDDVKKFIGEKQTTTLKIKQTVALRGLRKITADRLSASFRTAPHSTIALEVDVTEAVALHDQLGVSYTAMLVKVAAIALLDHSNINASLEGEQVKVFESANVGVAVATSEGLVVPVIKEADKKSVKQITRLIEELAEKAESGRLTKEDVSDGTFTITNLGMYDVDFFIPIINPPEAAILGVGAIVKRPVVVDEKIVVRPMMVLSLAYDHRVVDGAPAARFLKEIKEKMEQISKLVN